MDTLPGELVDCVVVAAPRFRLTCKWLYAAFKPLVDHIIAAGSDSREEEIGKVGNYYMRAFSGEISDSIVAYEVTTDDDSVSVEKIDYAADIIYNLYAYEHLEDINGYIDKRRGKMQIPVEIDEDLLYLVTQCTKVEFSVYVRSLPGTTYSYKIRNPWTGKRKITVTYPRVVIIDGHAEYPTAAVEFIKKADVDKIYRYMCNRTRFSADFSGPATAE